jgi:hypothetical protein
MPKSSKTLDQFNRKAAAALSLYAGVIVGVCFLVLRFTVWDQSVPVAREPFYTELPGVNMERLSPEKAEVVLKTLNLRRCHCGCMRSVASCRNHHDSCTESIVAAQDEANAVGQR